MDYIKAIAFDLYGTLFDVPPWLDQANESAVGQFRSLDASI